MSEHDHRIVDEELLFEYNALLHAAREFLEGAVSRDGLKYQVERVENALHWSQRDQEADPHHHTEYVRRTLAALDTKRVIHG